MSSTGSQPPLYVQTDDALSAVTEQVTSTMIQSVTEHQMIYLCFSRDMEQLFQQFFDIKIYGWLQRINKVATILFSIWYIIGIILPNLAIIPRSFWGDVAILIFVILFSYISSFYAINRISVLTYQRISSVMVMQCIMYIIWTRLQAGLILSAFLSVFIGRLLSTVLLRMRFWDGVVYTISFTFLFYIMVWMHTQNLYIETFSDSIIVTVSIIGITYLLELELRREFLHVATIHHLAIHDSLTGVFNRRHFMNQLEKEVALAQRYQLPLTLLMIDIDSFKEVNDRYGHAAGDEALRSISQVCMQELRIVDCFGRIGGEEFAVLLPNTDQRGGIELAERLRSKVAQEHIISEEHRFSCTLSLGVTQLIGNEVATALLDRADDALYKAKHQGKNQVVAV